MRKIPNRFSRFAKRRRLQFELLEARRVLAGAGDPFVQSITRLDTNPTNAAQVQYLVQFDEAVTGVDIADFALTTTGVTGASVGSVAGTADSYTVVVATGSGDGTLRLDVIDNNSIRDTDNNRLGGNGPNNGNFTSGEVYSLDKTGPLVNALTRLDASPNGSGLVSYELTLNESVSGVDLADFELLTSGVSGASVSSITGTGATYQIAVATGTGDGTLQLVLRDDDSIQDGVGNRLGGTGVGNGDFFGEIYTIDRAPEVLGILRTSNEFTNLPAVNFSVQFSEPVTGVDIADFFPTSSVGITGASVTSISGAGDAWQVTVDTGTGDGSLGLGVLPNSIQDLTGNPLVTPVPPSERYTVDRTSPVVSSIVPLDTTYTNANSVRFEVTFSEIVTGVDVNDFIPSQGSGLTGASVTGIVGSGSVYEVTLDTGTGSGSLYVRVANSAQVFDLASNPLTPTTPGGQGYIIDRIAPTVLSLVRLDSTPSNSAVVRYEVEFSESVLNVGLSDFVLNTTGLTGATVVAVGSTNLRNYTVHVNTGSGDGTLALELITANLVADFAGNPLAAGIIGPGYTIDKTSPDLIALVRNDASPTNATTVSYTATFSEPVTGVDAGTFSVIENGLSGSSIASVTENGAQYDILLAVGTGEGTLNLGYNYSVSDAAGNTATASGQSGQPYTVDREDPVVSSITPLTAGPTAAYEVTFDILFSEYVTGVDVSDFQVVAPGLTNSRVFAITTTGDGAFKARVITGTGDGTLYLSLVDDNTIFDALGNPLGGPGPNNGNFTSPTGTIVKKTVEFSGTVWEDTNADGYFDAGESPLVGTRVFIDLNQDGVFDSGAEPSQLTSADGSYLFAGLNSGNYWASLVHPPEIQQTFPARGGPNRLTLRDTSFREGTPAMEGARAVAIDPSNRFAYVSGSASNSINAYEINGSTGELSLVQTIAEGDLGATGLRGSYRMTVSPDGSQLFVTSVSDERLGIFAIDSNSGELSFSQAFTHGVGGVNGMNFTHGVDVSPDGKNVYVSGDGIATFQRDLNTGVLTFAEATFGLSNSFDVEVSPDGMLLAATETAGRLNIYARSQADGSLTLLQTLIENIDAGTDLLFARSVAFSPDSQHVYVAASTDDAVSVFARQPNDTFAFVQSVKDQQDGVLYLQSALGVEVSPDGKLVYVTGELDSGLTVFRRDLQSGELSLFEDFHESLQSGISTLTRADQIAVSPNGSYVLVTARNDDAVTLFENGFGFPIPEPQDLALPAATFREHVDFGLADLNPVAILATSEPNPTSAATAEFVLSVNEPVSGVDLSDFALQTTGLTGTSLISVTPNGNDFTVLVNTGSGSGEIRLELNDDDSIVDGKGNPLFGAGTSTAAVASTPLLVDRTGPEVISIEALDPLAGTRSSGRFEVTFSENASGVDAADFVPITNGTLSGASISSVSGGGQIYVVTVEVTAGNGQFGVEVIDDDSIVDALGNPLGGVGVGNGGFTSNVFYASENSGESSISGIKWNDANQNGVRDASETALSGWTVYADVNRNGQLDTGEPSSVTAADGSYTISGLFSGDYVIREVWQPGWKQTFPIHSQPIERLGGANSGSTRRDSNAPSVSADGRFVAFDSSQILFPGDTSASDIFVHDRVSGTLEKISVGLGGALSNGQSYEPTISNDGRYVAFYSSASNLVVDDTNNFDDVFVFDRNTSTTTRVSIGMGGVEANGDSGPGVSISGNGQVVAFTSTASNLASNDTSAKDVFVYDFSSGTTELVSQSSVGVAANNHSNHPVLNDDGTIVAFDTIASNLVPGDTNVATDIFIRDRSAGSTRRISVSPSGAQAFAHSYSPALSGDGSLVAFWTNATNFSAEDTNGSPDTYAYNLATGDLELVSYLPNGDVAGDSIVRPSVNSDGSLVAFTTSNSLVSPGKVPQVLIRDRSTQTSRLIPQAYDEIAPEGNLGITSISDDGSTLAFASDSKRLIPNDLNFSSDIFVTDLTQEVVRYGHTVSVGVSESLPNQDFGNWLVTGSLSGQVWQDTNRNGIRDGVESGISGRTVFVDANLNGTLDAGELSQITDANGSYQFDSLVDGTYPLRQVLPANWTEHAPTSPHDVVLGEQVFAYDFEQYANTLTTFRSYSEIIQDDFIFSTSLGGFTQWRVYGSNSSINPPSTEIVSASASAGNFIQRSGAEEFTPLELGLRYFSTLNGPVEIIGEKRDGSFVRQTVSPTNQATVFTLNGFDDIVALRWKSGQNFVGLALDNVKLAAPLRDITALDFGSMADPGSIQGEMYLDENRNGVRDAGEGPLVGREVFVDYNLNQVLDSGEPVGTTDGNGVYSITGVNPGTITVRPVPVTHWKESEPGDGYSVNLAAGGQLSGLVFGSWVPPAAIEGTKWHDIDRNGVRDPGEPGLAGWTIYLDLNENGELDAGDILALTNADNPATPDIDESGTYRFEGVSPGTYSVREVAQAGWTQTSPHEFGVDLTTHLYHGYDYGGFIHHDNWDHATNADGSLVVFSSTANLLPADTNNFVDIYLLDRNTDQLSLITPNSTGSSYEPDISDDGRFISFRTFASFVSEDTLPSSEVYVYDRQLMQFEFASPAIGGGSSNNWVLEPKLSANGRVVTFFSAATNLTPDATTGLSNYYARYLDSNTTVRINKNSDAVNTWGGELSSDASKFVFESLSPSLVPDDTNGVADIFVFDTNTGDTVRVNTSSDGVQANGVSSKRAISGDGRWVVFDSTATNLTDHSFFGSYNVFLKDLVTGETRLVSRNYQGIPASGRRPEISYDGRWITFESTSQNMFPDSSNSYSSIYLYDRLLDRVVRLSQTEFGAKANGPSTNANISRDGTTVVFASNASNLGQGSGLITADLNSLLNQPLANHVNLPEGQTFGGVDFGNATTTSSIQGVAFRDLNSNGVRDSGEGPFSGITVYLDLNDDGQLGAGEPSHVTDSLGNYVFAGLAPGSYAVRQVLEPRFEQISPMGNEPVRVFNDNFNELNEIDPGTGATINTLSKPEQGDGLAYGKGTLFLVSKATRQLYFLDPDDGSVLDTMLLPAGNYDGLAFLDSTLYVLDSTADSVLLVDPVQKQVMGGFDIQGVTHQVDAWDGLGESGDGQFLVTADATNVYFVSPSNGLVVSSFPHGIDFSRRSETISSLAGASGEIFLMPGDLGNRLQVFDDAGNRLRTGLTDGRQPHSLAAGQATDLAFRLTLGWSENFVGADFADRPQLSSLSGRQFSDTDGNGSRDTGETELPNVDVYLDLNDNAIWDSGEPMTTSDLNGNYRFDDLPAGEYVVRSIPLLGNYITTTIASDRIFGAFLHADSSSTSGARVGVTEFDSSNGSVLGSYITTIPGDEEIGLAFDGEQLLLLNRFDQSLYEISVDGQSLNQSPLFHPTTAGLAYLNGLAYYIEPAGWPNLIAYDPKTHAVVKRVALTHSLDGYGTGVFPTLADGLGVALDGASLIATTYDTAGADPRLIQIDPITGRVTDYESWAVPDDRAVTSMGGELFVSVAHANSVRVFDNSGSVLRGFPAFPSRYFGMAGGEYRDAATRIVLGDNESLTGLDIGQREEKTQVTGHLFHDLNANGSQELGEPDIVGVQVYVDANGNRRLDAGEPTANTDGGGNYLLPDLTAGNHQIRVIPPAGFEVTTPQEDSLRLFGLRLDSASGLLQELNPLNGEVMAELPLPSGFTLMPDSGLAFDGRWLYLIDDVTDTLYTLDPNDGDVFRSQNLPAATYEGLAAVGGEVFAMDSGRDRLVRIDPWAGIVLEDLDINQLNPDYFGVGTTIDLELALGESHDGTQIVAWGSGEALFIDPATGIIQDIAPTGTPSGFAGAAGERAGVAASGNLMPVYNSRDELVRWVRVESGLVALGMGLSNASGQLVLTQQGDSITQDFGLRDTSVPTDIVLSSNTLFENSPVGTEIGELSAVDPIPQGVFTFELVAGPGDEDNLRFAIVGNRLQSNAILDFESQDTHSIRVRTVDPSGYALERRLMISIENVPELAAPIQIGDGTDQRSNVNQIVVDFDSPVQLGSNAFEVHRRIPDGNGGITLDPIQIDWNSQVLPSGETRVIIGFLSNVRAGGNLLDGNYQLSIQGDAISAVANGAQFDGDGDLTQGGTMIYGDQAADRFFAYFGDRDGDRDVDLADYVFFRRVYRTSGIPSEFDYDNDVDVDLADYVFFRRNYRSSLPF